MVKPKKAAARKKTNPNDRGDVPIPYEAQLPPQTPPKELKFEIRIPKSADDYAAIDAAQKMFQQQLTSSMLKTLPPKLRVVMAVLAHEHVPLGDDPIFTEMSWSSFESRLKDLEVHLLNDPGLLAPDIRIAAATMLRAFGRTGYVSEASPSKKPLPSELAGSQFFDNGVLLPPEASGYTDRKEPSKAEDDIPRITVAPASHEVAKRRYSAGKSVTVGVRVKEHIREALKALAKARKKTHPATTMGQIASELLEEAVMQSLPEDVRRKWVDEQVSEFARKTVKRARLG